MTNPQLTLNSTGKTKNIFPKTGMSAFTTLNSTKYWKF